MTALMQCRLLSFADLQALLVEMGAVKRNDSRLGKGDDDSDDQMKSGVRAKKMFSSNAGTSHDEADSD